MKYCIGVCSFLHVFVYIDNILYKYSSACITCCFNFFKTVFYTASWQPLYLLYSKWYMFLLYYIIVICKFNSQIIIIIINRKYRQDSAIPICLIRVQTSACGCSTSGPIVLPSIRRPWFVTLLFVAGNVMEIRGHPNIVAISTQHIHYIEMTKSTLTRAV